MKNTRARRPTITLEFSESGDFLTAIYFNAETDKGQAMLERAFTRIMNPGHLGWIRRLFKRE